MFAFTTGEIWCVDTTLLNLMGHKHLYFQQIARSLVANFRGYGQFLKCLGIEPPFKWIAGIEGVKGWKLQVPAPSNHFHLSPGKPCLSETVSAEGLYDLQQSPQLALRPFFNQLFRKCGLTMPEHIERMIQGSSSF